jgi:hypothetical protein
MPASIKYGKPFSIVYIFLYQPPKELTQPKLPFTVLKWVFDTFKPIILYCKCPAELTVFLSFIHN